jgi:hypothetical protein
VGSVSVVTGSAFVEQAVGHFEDDAGIIALRNEGVDHPPIQNRPPPQEEITFLREEGKFYPSISGLGARLTSRNSLQPKRRSTEAI